MDSIILSRNIKTSLVFFAVTVTISVVWLFSGVVRAQKIGKEEVITKEDGKILLNMARKSLETYINSKGKKNYQPGQVPVRLQKKTGCFVTLKKKGQLRGCIGYIKARGPLYQCVLENAVNAAVHDNRFSRVIPKELSEITIEISVLTPPRRFNYKKVKELLDKLKPGQDGVILRQGYLSATYLPSVWEQLPDKEMFLSHLCRKGGMSSGCFRKLNQTQVFLYRSLHFEEP